MTEKYNSKRDFFRARMRGTTTASQDWEVLQAVVGFAFTIQQEFLRLRRDTSAMLSTLAQQQSASVKAGYPAVLQRIVLSAQNLTEASGAAIALGNEQNMICVARSGACSPPLDSSFDPRFGLGGECVRTRESVICMNAAADPRVDYNACTALGVRSMVYCPLLADGKVVGVLAVFSGRPQHFSHRDVNCLRWTDDLIAEAISTGEKAQLGVGALIRDAVAAEIENEPAGQEIITPALPTISIPVPAAPEPKPASAVAAPKALPVPEAKIEARALVKEEPQEKPVFVGRIVDESVADDEDEPSLTFGGKPAEKYDSPVPMLIATILVMAFLVVVGLMSYYHLESKPSAKPPATQQPASIPATTEPVPASTNETATPAQTAPPPDSASDVKAESQPLTAFPASMEFHSEPSRSVLRVKFDQAATYQGFAIKNPDRLYFDLRGVSLVGPKGAYINVKDNLVARVRISMHSADTTRIVFDLHRAADYEIVQMPDGKGLSIELHPKAESATVPPVAGDTSVTIVIDPGHGGRDTGTKSLQGLNEKDLTLDLAKRLGSLLENRLGAKVVYTRTTDEFVSLSSRAAIANNSHADFLISIHGNYSSFKSVRGIETYYFQNSQDALTRASDTSHRGAQEDNVPDAKTFASDVHRALLHGLSDKDQATRNRGLKTASFVVLREARMPAVLAEVAFMSSRKDAQRLESSEYRDRVAKALFQGIRNHLARRDASALAAFNVQSGSPVATR